MKARVLAAAALCFVAHARASRCEAQLYLAESTSRAFVKLRDRAAAIPKRFFGLTFGRSRPAANPGALNLDPYAFARTFKDGVRSLLDAHALKLHPLNERFFAHGMADARFRLSFARRKLLAELPRRFSVMRSLISGREFYLVYLGGLDNDGRPPTDVEANSEHFFVLTPDGSKIEIIPIAKFRGSLTEKQIAVAANEVPCPDARTFAKYELTERFLTSGNYLFNVRRMLMYDRTHLSALRRDTCSVQGLYLDEPHRKELRELAGLGAGEALFVEGPKASEIDVTSGAVATDRLAPFRNYMTEGNFRDELGTAPDISRFASRATFKATMYSLEALRITDDPEVRRFFDGLGKISPLHVSGGDKAVGFLANTVAFFQEFEGIDLRYANLVREWIEVGTSVEMELLAAQRALAKFEPAHDLVLAKRTEIERSLMAVRESRNSLNLSEKLFLAQLNAIEDALLTTVEARGAQEAISIIEILKNSTAPEVEKK